MRQGGAWMASSVCALTSIFLFFFFCFLNLNCIESIEWELNSSEFDVNVHQATAAAAPKNKQTTATHVM